MLFSLRANPENPSTNLADPASWLVDALGGSKTVTGRRIDHSTALTNSAVFACVRVLSESIASLPLIVYRRLERGKEEARDHPLFEVLHNRPNPLMSSFVFRETAQAHLATWGNFYAEIERDGNRRPRHLWPLLPDRTRPEIVSGRKVLVTRINDEDKVIGPGKFLHVPGLGYDGFKGYSVIKMQRQAIALGLAAEEFGARWFGSGSRPSGVLRHPETLSDEAQKRLREQVENQSQGLDNAQRIMVLEEGMEWTQISVPPNDAQFLETRKFSVADIARIYRIPPHMIGDLERATFSNIEQQAIEFHQHTLLPWLTRWEQILTYELLTEAERKDLFVCFDVSGLLRGDSEAQAKWFASGRQWGYLSENDIRETLNLPIIEGADNYLVPANMTPIDMLRDQDGDEPEPPDEDLNGDRQKRSKSERSVLARRSKSERSVLARRTIREAFVDIFRQTASRLLRKETNALNTALKRATSVKEFVSLAQDFLEGFEDEIRDEIVPVYVAVARAVRGEVFAELDIPDQGAELEGIAQQLAVAYAARHVGISFGQLQNIESLEEVMPRLDEWESSRAEKIAALEATRSVGSLSRHFMSDGGVTVFRWVAFGDSCPTCNALNGKVVGVDTPFAEPGTELPSRGEQPFVVRKQVLHPPIHKGCDCAIAAG